MIMVSLKKAVSSLTALMFLLVVGSTANAAIFSEDFETIPLDTTNWKADNGGAGEPLSTDAAPADEYARFVNTVSTEGSGALLLGDGDGNGSNYLFAEYKTTVARGNNVHAQLESWVGQDTPYNTTSTTRPYGPWHSDSNGIAGDGPVGLPQSMNIAGIGDGGSTNCKFITTNAWQNGPEVEQAFVDAWMGADGRANSIWIKMWLGNTDGGYGEWSVDNGSTWTPFKDTTGATIDLRDSGTNATDPAFLALGGPQSGSSTRYYDNVSIGDDNSAVPNPSSLAVPVEISGFDID